MKYEASITLIERLVVQADTYEAAYTIAENRIVEIIYDDYFIHLEPIEEEESNTHPKT